MRGTRTIIKTRGIRTLLLAASMAIVAVVSASAGSRSGVAEQAPNIRNDRANPSPGRSRGGDTGRAHDRPREEARWIGGLPGRRDRRAS